MATMTIDEIAAVFAGKDGSTVVHFKALTAKAAGDVVEDVNDIHYDAGDNQEVPSAAVLRAKGLYIDLA